MGHQSFGLYISVVDSYSLDFVCMGREGSAVESSCDGGSIEKPISADLQAMSKEEGDLDHVIEGHTGHAQQKGHEKKGII
jgi:hypothetical protein